MQPMTTKFGSLLGISVVYDLTFSDSGSMASSNTSTVQSFQRGIGYFLSSNAVSRNFSLSQKIS